MEDEVLMHSRTPTDATVIQRPGEEASQPAPVRAMPSRVRGVLIDTRE